MTKRVRIFDTTLRDGEQASGVNLFPEEKVRIARQLIKLGIDVIEPGFPISSPAEFQAVQMISRISEQVEVSAFARVIKEDIDAALKATEDAVKRRLFLFVSSSQVHLEHQLRKTRQQVISMAREMVAYGRQFVDQIEFAPMDATRSDKEFLIELIEAVIEEGATIIKIPDTVGYTLPKEYGRLFTLLRSEVRGGDQVSYGAHCHNDLGMALANSFEAIQCGADQVDVTVNGIGERAGNCSLEELAMLLETRKDAMDYTTGINTSEIYETSKLVSRLLNYPLALTKPIVGRNVFRHESGIHQDGILKHQGTYEIIDPAKVGVSREMIVLGKHSGRHAIKHKLEKYGINLPESGLDIVYNRFKEWTSSNKHISDDVLLQFAEVPRGEAALGGYSLVQTRVQSNVNKNVTVCLTLQNNQTSALETYTDSGTEVMETVFRCIRQAVPIRAILQELEVHILDHENGATACANVVLAIDGTQFTASSTDSDVIFAAARAFLTACQLVSHKDTEPVH